VPRYRLTIAYDGTDFCGWQKQEPPSTLNVDPAMVLAPAAADAAAAGSEGTDQSRITLRTVQEVVERAVREVVRERSELVGASRTDSGVHARGQVAAFTCSDEAWPTARGTTALLRAINSRLPDDVLVMGAEETTADFNPIGGATSKAYSYALHVSPHRPLWDRRFVHHVWVPLDLERMREAAARIAGEHDFAAFAAAGHGRLSTVRTVFSCGVIEEGGGAGGHEGTQGAEPTWAGRVRIEISGSGFLWNMVRIVAGTLVDVGRGRLSPDDVSRAIESKDRRLAGPTLPPTGLCLEWIRYDAAAADD
jgi:tRNA pseudouridine38-40 synthase